jgi:hypothetical protein
MSAAVSPVAAAVQLGYYGFREQQALRTALLARQQELEQSEWQMLVCATHKYMPFAAQQQIMPACATALHDGEYVRRNGCHHVLSLCNTSLLSQLAAKAVSV